MGDILQEAQYFRKTQRGGQKTEQTTYIRLDRFLKTFSSTKEVTMQTIGRKISCRTLKITICSIQISVEYRANKSKIVVVVKGHSGATQCVAWTESDDPILSSVAPTPTRHT
jgi:hypothetical protein